MTFKITVQPSGLAFKANENESILDAALNANLVIQYGCKSGACGACICKVTSGEFSVDEHLPYALTEEEKQQGVTLACCTTAKSDLTIEVHVSADEKIFSSKQYSVEVVEMKKLDAETMVVNLAVMGDATLDFNPGQYIDFILNDGARRSYSMASLPSAKTADGRQCIELHIRLVPSGRFTTHVFEKMKVGDTWGIEGPLGTFYLRQQSNKPVILVVSGTGFAPVKGILEHMFQAGIERETVLYWGGRRPKDLYMQEWIKEQQKKIPLLRFVPVISDALPEDNWQGRTGFVHHAVMEDFPELSTFQVYACGTPVMVDSAQKDFVEKCNLSVDEFMMDSFTAANK